MSENVEFIVEMTRLIRKHYPDGKMPVGDITTYFGMVMAAAVATQPWDVRDRVAREMAKMIRVPKQELIAFAREQFGDHRN